MRKVKYHHALTLLLSDQQRTTIEEIAERREMSLGEAARFVFDAGIQKLNV